MTKEVNGGIDRIESAADITLFASVGATPAGSAEDADEEAQMMEIPISRLDNTKDIEISEIRENTLKANGYSVTSISFSGTLMFKGSKYVKDIDSDTEAHLDDILYDENGVPQPVSVTINHDRNDEYEVLESVLVTSDSYEVRNEEATETAFDFVAMDKSDSRPN